MGSRSNIGRAAGNGVPRVVPYLLLLCAMWPAASFAGGIVADGHTSTTVSTASNGHQTVSIAPAVYGVSQNTYSSFSVGSAGATLNNTGINARTIVNQVTGTNPSLIEGAIDVTGPTANVVLANPNGITVNGGSFVRTGHVALTTGQVSFDDVQIAPGAYQRNVQIATSGGTIVVGPQGLSSALVDLDLIAKNIQIDGPLANTFTSSTALTRLVAGTSSVTLNTGLSPTDNANDWLTAQAASTPPTATSFAIDITAAGSLTSGRVELIVTDHGPGVRSAGPLSASLGDFTLTSNGSVQISNTTVSAANNLSFQTQDNITLNDAQLSASNGSVTLATAQALNLTGSSVLANTGIDLSGAGIALSADSAANGSTVASATAGVVLTSSGDIDNIGSLIQGETTTTTDSASHGAVTLNAGGNVLNQTLTTGGLAILFGVKDDVSITAGGSVTNENARILSNDNVSIAATGDVDNIVDHSNGVDGGVPVITSSEGNTFLFLRHRNRSFDVDYGELDNPNALSYITADAGNVSISGANVSNVGGSILSNGGSISIAAAQNLLTQGVFTGQASFSQSCFIFCRSSASSDVQVYGGAIEANNDITLKAGTQISNIGGTVDAIGKLTLDAPKTLAEGVLGYTTINEVHNLKAWFGNTWSAIYASDTGGLFVGGSGQVELTGEGDIQGGVFSAPGGVNAKRGIVTIAAPYTAPVNITSHNNIGLVSWFGL
ncbi:filamentous hemagglutinin N-terminal domain-containing protein [Paraburkholderia phosphatilytica]|uniref:two-partner secretion domain-containing protein n=1 Tax=Paraburkholderia phosphatilytica TaxID=2282883 RepID=UPI000E531D20|nr:filamentous hemagglutinin N-terminal domain-containing protein [Paraburkholderia phosphatilytica]